MHPNEYQKLAARTECDQQASRLRMYGADGWIPIRLNQAVIGLAGEVGELASLLERWIYYGKWIDQSKLAADMADELGDCLWYIAEACNALGLDMGQVMEANINKLKSRYPDRYNDAAADPANRDRAAEAQAVKQSIKEVSNAP